MTTELTTYDLDGRRARVYRAGEGRPLVYLHSGFGEVGPLPVLTDLAAQGLAVYAPEIPGFGESEAFPEWQHISDVVFTLRRILDELELDRAVLVGSSLGGWLAAELAVWFPNRIDALVLLGAVGLKVPGAPIFDLFSEGQRDTWRRAFPHGYKVDQIVAGDDDAKFLHFFSALETLARIGWNPFLHNPALPGRLSLIEAPTLVVWGADDGIAPRAHGEAYSAGIPNARLEILDHCGHLPALERPLETAALIAEWVPSGAPGGPMVAAGARRGQH
jgi:pimeloyl-ACP methyl ester carboxylesterase